MARKPAPTPAAPVAAAAAPVTNELLAQIVSATQAGGFAYASIAAAQAAGIVIGGDESQVEYNAGMTNPENGEEVAFRATQKGIDAVSQPVQNTGSETPPQAPAPVQPQGTAKVTYEIEDVVPEAVKRQRGASNKYPFDQLGVNQSFHVPVTTDEPNPAKAMASTVSSANARYATEARNPDGTPKLREGTRRQKQADGTIKTWKEQVPEYEYSRKFEVRTVGENDPKGKGARVVRVK